MTTKRMSERSSEVTRADRSAVVAAQRCRLSPHGVTRGGWEPIALSGLWSTVATPRGAGVRPVPRVLGLMRAFQARDRGGVRS